MKWGIITDTHNIKGVVEKAIALFNKEHCSHVFHCGDFISEEIFNMFCDQKFNFHYVTDHSSHDSNLLNNKLFFSEEIDGFLIGMMHNTYEKIKINNSKYQVNDFISSDCFDYFFYRHLHYLNFKLQDAESKTIAYFYGDCFSNIFRIFLNMPIDKCIMYYSGTPLKHYFKAFNYYKKKLNIDYYNFSHFADYLWLNKNLEIFDKMNYR